MNVRGRSRVTLVLILLFVFSIASVEASQRRNVASHPVHLLWYDPYGLMPARAYEAIRAEVENVFHRTGLDVRVIAPRLGENILQIPEPAIRAVLHPAEPGSWGLDPSVMAAAVGTRDTGYSIFVFHPAVLRVLSARPSRGAPPDTTLARAMGRILAHELVHVLAPGRGHARFGLMAETLSLEVLTGAGVVLDLESLRLARAAASDYRRSPSGAEEPGQRRVTVEGLGSR